MQYKEYKGNVSIKMSNERRQEKQNYNMALIR